MGPMPNSDTAGLQRDPLAQELMTSLVVDVAHDVRNSLFAISATLDALEAQVAFGEEHQQGLEVMRMEIERVTRLTRDLLGYGRPESGSSQSLSMGAVIEPLLQAIDDQARKRGVSVTTRVENEVPCLLMDPHRMLQVLRNLLENALRRTPSGGAVTVLVRAMEGSRLEIRIQDEGPGIPEEDLRQVFEPFFSRGRGSTGLELSIVQRIVEAHRGQVTASNLEQGGIEMRLCFQGTDGKAITAR